MGKPTKAERDAILDCIYAALEHAATARDNLHDEMADRVCDATEIALAFVKRERLDDEKEPSHD